MFYYVIAKDIGHALVGPFLNESEANAHVDECKRITGLSGNGHDGTSYEVKPADRINLWAEGIHMLHDPKRDLEILRKCESQYPARLEHAVMEADLD